MCRIDCRRSWRISFLRVIWRRWGLIDVRTAFRNVPIVLRRVRQRLKARLVPRRQPENSGSLAAEYLAYLEHKSGECRLIAQFIRRAIFRDMPAQSINLNALR